MTPIPPTDPPIDAGKARWSVQTNRHPQSRGGEWGWIEGHPENKCWSQYSAFDKAAATLLVNEHNAMLAARKEPAP